MRLHKGGADDWESFYVERHLDGFALKNFASNGYVAAQTSGTLKADGGEKGEWEKFFIWKGQPYAP